MLVNASPNKRKHGAPVVDMAQSKLGEKIVVVDPLFLPRTWFEAPATRKNESFDGGAVAASVTPAPNKASGHAIAAKTTACLRKPLCVIVKPNHKKQRKGKMNVKEAYDIWSYQYDTNENKTRDLEAIALRQNLKGQKFSNCLEIGCGTGKNTEWLVSIADTILAVDLSEEMLSKAKQKVNSENVKIVQADINEEWSFVDNKNYDLVIFSLVLEHIENLDLVFKRLNEIVNLNGIIYIGELHPFKQYSGTKARFETADGIQVVTCFHHNISDFANSAKKYNFQIIDINEYFDNNDKNIIPRILTMIFKKR